MADDRSRVVIVGGGPVGTLSALFLSRKGFKVDLYEARSDIRAEKNATGRSINFTLSIRGLTALKHAGIDETIKAIGIPLHARYIHTNNGGHHTISYGKGQELLSTNRLDLNRKLLSVAEKCQNVSIHFEHKLVKCNTKNPSATFQKADGEFLTTGADLLVGCDGAHSAVRGQMVKERMDYSQMYIEHGYKELRIPQTAEGNYAMPPNYFHIWPKREFMLIAMPNLDKSFTCTLFMPFKIFDAMVTGDDVVSFFNEHFKGVVSLIGESELRSSFFTLPPMPLITLKCSAFHSRKTTIILGDAAHAVLPFYGQALNCGLEDTLIFDELMKEYKCDFEKVLPEFSRVRIGNCHALADLSLYNYMVMRSYDATKFRNKVENLLCYLFPAIFQLRYSMVVFTRMPYETVIKRAENQDKIINKGIAFTGYLFVAATAFVIYRLNCENGC